MRQKQFQAVALFALAFCLGQAAHADGEFSLPAPPPPPAFFSTHPEADPRLAADTRLDHKVTLNEIGTPLGDLLAKESLADLPLTCGPDCADQKLQVRVQNRSLRSVLAALAQMMPGTWKREGKGYCLYRDPKATEYQNQWWQLYGQERERVFAALRAEILADMQKKPVSPDSDPFNPEDMSYDTLRRMAQCQEFWNLLPEPLQEQIAGQIVDSVFYRSGIVSSVPQFEGAVVVPFQSLAPQAQADLLANAETLRVRPGPINFDPAQVAFNNIGFNVRPKILSKSGHWFDVGHPLQVNFLAIAGALPVNHARLPYLMKSFGAQAPQTWLPLLQYQQQRVWANGPSPVVLNPDSALMTSIPRRLEVLNWLADKAGLEFIADYYFVPGDPLSETQRNQRLGRPLKKEMDFRAVQEDMSWKQRTDGLYLFRDNRWYRDDRLEVPNKTLKGLLRTLQAAETPTQATPTAEPDVPNNSLAAQLNVADDIVAQLTPWQIANGLPNYTIEPTHDPAKASSAPAKLHKTTMTMNGKTRTFYLPTSTSTARPFSEIADIILDDYHTYLFHSGLTSVQADALLTDGLPVSALSSTQAQQAAYLLPDLQVRFENQPQTSIGLRPEPGFDQVQLSPTGFPAATLPLQRIRLVVSAPNNMPNGDSVAP